MRNSFGWLSAAVLGALLSQAFQRMEPALAQSTTSAAVGQDGLILGIGGTEANRNDLCWVLQRKGADEVHLAAYWGTREGVKLLDSRDIHWDLQVVQLSNVDPKVKDIKTGVEKNKKDEEEESTGKKK